MSDPIVADIKPIAIELEKGAEYHYCRCGRTKSQPWCDGSHVGTGITPLAFTPEESGDGHVCMCRQTGTPPYCDGTHAQLTPDQKGMELKLQTGSADAMPEAQPTAEEPTVAFIHQLARDGLGKLGHHGEMAAMGVPRDTLPRWDDIQLLPGQLDPKPLMEDVSVGTELVIGPGAKKPLQLRIPLFVSDMSFGALSEEAKTAMAKGAELAGTGICSGEGGMLPEEQQANSRYFYELASARFGFKDELLERVQAFHFKGGQGAKTGTGGHLPGSKNVGKISQVRGIKEGEPAVSPPTFADFSSAEDFRKFADRVRSVSGGIPVGFKLSANRIEQDMEFALAVGVDYIILDGRGGGTGAAPLLFRDHISVPTIPALARARRFLDSKGVSGKVTLIITGGLRLPPDFVKAMALGADGIALANSAMQAIGCVAARICNTNNCPAGIATQRPELRKRLPVEEGARRLTSYLGASIELMQVLARACGHSHLNQFCPGDLTTWKKEMAELSGVQFGGVSSLAGRTLS